MRRSDSSECPEEEGCLDLEPAGVDGRLPPAEARKAGESLGEDPEKPEGRMFEELPPWFRSSLRAWGGYALADRLRSGSELPKVDDLVGTFGRSGRRAALDGGTEYGDLDCAFACVWMCCSLDDSGSVDKPVGEPV
jgi:hypothetical protein